jgi:hypothetical protein
MFLSIDGGRSWIFNSGSPKGVAIDVFNFGGGRCQTYRQHPVGAPPSTSSTSVVATVGPTDSTPQGVRHRRLQLWWWPLSDMPPAPLRGPAIDVFNFSGGRYRICRQHPLGSPPSMSSTLVVAAVGSAASTPHGTHLHHLQLRWLPMPELPTTPPGAHDRRLQLRCWLLSDMPPAPPRGSPSTSSTSVVSAVGPTDSTPRGAAIDVFYFGGGHCRKYRRHLPRVIVDVS